MYTWRIANQDDFHPIYALIYASDDRSKWDLDHIRRRVVTPLFLEQLIVFHDKDAKLCGFLTYAMMDCQSACHQSTSGVLASDWRSGDQLWVVDFFAPFGGAEKMLLKIRKNIEESVHIPVRYFRLKTRQIRRAYA